MRGARIVVVVLGFFGASARADPAADIAQIHLEAIGGRARIAAMQGLRMSGVVVVGTQRLRFRMIAARPNRVRLETQNGGRTLINASDGVEPAWEFDTGTWPPRYHEMAPAAARGFTADAEFDDPLVAGSARGFALDYAGETEFDGRKMLRLLVTKNLADSFTLLIDAETYFVMLRAEERMTTTGRKRKILTRYDDFRPVDGVLLPHRVTLMTDGRVEQQMIVEKIETNPELTAETFTRPKAPAAGKK